MKARGESLISLVSFVSHPVHVNQEVTGRLPGSSARGPPGPWNAWRVSPRPARIGPSARTRRSPNAPRELTVLDSHPLASAALFFVVRYLLTRQRSWCGRFLVAPTREKNTRARGGRDPVPVCPSVQPSFSGSEVRGCANIGCLLPAERLRLQVTEVSSSALAGLPSPTPDPLSCVISDTPLGGDLL